ncbi:MAG: RNA polymerase sigma factor [Leptospiraceae bacterium]|nr:RNA polymerase sigma factor [Leptospiraceae bacterium]MCK6380718.1 RNA polymerase sigma factor [Leptospiraceae bacterium]NUM41237.1 RNA polymerase sigma factor [Leptospiraceae bacterium]
MKKNLPQLLNECVQGNEGAWRIFIEKYHRLINGTVSKYSNGTEVDDIVQHVYEKLIEKDYNLLNNFQGESEAGFIVYLKRISQNIALSESRNHNRKDKYINGAEHDLVFYADKRTGHEILLEEFMENKNIQEAIMKLDLPYREVIVLRMEGYKFKEIAEIVNAPLNTVLTQFDRAKKKLKNFLPDEIIS